MFNLSAVILANNEEHQIGACIDALRWCDQVVILDSHSHDTTIQTAQAHQATTLQRAFDNYANQRNAALDLVESRWVFFVDADERATPALAEEVRAVIGSGGHVGWWVPRRNFIIGREMRGAGYWPDYQLRLLRRDRARYDPSRPVHEVVNLDGGAGYLQEPLLHYNYTSWDQFHSKQRMYAGYEARVLSDQGIRPRPHNFVLQPWREFWRRYVRLRGYQDGWTGLRLCFWLAYYYGAYPYWVLMRQSPATKGVAKIG